MHPSRLAEQHKGLVLDASTVLNLLGTGHVAKLLTLLGRRITVSEEAAAETVRDPLGGGPGSIAIADLTAAGLLEIVTLSTTAYDAFTNLIAAPSPDGLDDGEAATLALALDHDFTAVLDERKAERIARELIPSRPPLCTIDLLSHPSIVANLGETMLSEMVFSALKYARMRVPVTFRTWVLERVGEDRISQCPSFGRVRPRT